MPPPASPARARLGKKSWRWLTRAPPARRAAGSLIIVTSAGPARGKRDRRGCARTVSWHAHASPAPRPPRASAGVLALLNPFEVLHLVRSIWNIIFGTIMLLIQFNFQSFISRNFGFLKHWFLREQAPPPRR